MSEDRRSGVADESLVARTRLVAKLDAVPRRPLALIIAGAGFGKSSVVRAWLESLSPAWLDLTAADREPPALIAHLASQFEALGSDGELIAALRAVGSGGADAETQARFVAAALERRAARHPDRLHIVLDDLHEIGRGRASALVGSLVRQLPEGTDVTLISRAPVPFPIQRLRARGIVHELSAMDLAFDEEEVAAVLETGLGPAGRDLSRDVFDLTQGWPATIRLVVETLRAVPASMWRAHLLARRTRIAGLFDYLAEEVLAREPDNVLDVIRAIAPFDVVDAELCTALGLEDAAEVLDDFERRGLFVRSAESGSGYVVHRLIREYALDRIAGNPQREAAAWRSVARWHIRNGRLEDAIRAAIMTDDSPLLAGLIDELGRDLLARGQADLVIDAVGRLSPQSRTRSAILALGDARAFRGQLDEALATYEQARAEAGAAPADLAWRIARVHMDLADPASARRALDAADPATNPVDRALLMGYRALAGFAASESNLVALCTEAVVAADESGDATARSIAHAAASYALIARDARAARRHRRIAIDEAERAGDVVQLVRLRNADDESRSLNDQFESATTSLQIVEAAGNPTWTVRTLVTRGLIALDQGQLEIAAADFARARHVAAVLGPLVELMPIAFAAELGRIRGDMAQAAVGFERAITGADAAGDARIAAYARAGLARLLARSEPARSVELVERALSEAADHDRPDALLAAAWIAACQGRSDDARSLSRATVEAVGLEPGRLAALGSALEVDAMIDGDPTGRRARLEEATSIWERIGNAGAAAQTRLALAVDRWGVSSRQAEEGRRAVRAAGIRSSASEAAGILMLVPAIAPPAVAIRLLGGFGLLRDGVPVPVGDWKSRKARELLKILVVRHGVPIAREEISGLLWPERNEAPPPNALSVVLSLLRRVLDPDRSRPADAYVMSDRQSVALRPGALEVDLDAFLDEARAGLQRFEAGPPAAAIDLLLAADARYGGELLPEDPYADWAVAPREQARGVYVRCAMALAEAAAATGERGARSRYLMRAIAADPDAEDAHLALVRALALEDRTSEARRAYQAYARRMSELGVEAAPYPAA